MIGRCVIALPRLMIFNSDDDLSSISVESDFVITIKNGSLIANIMPRCSPVMSCAAQLLCSAIDPLDKRRGRIVRKRMIVYGVFKLFIT